MERRGLTELELCTCDDMQGQELMEHMQDVPSYGGRCRFVVPAGQWQCLQLG